jgi:3-oxoacyl-[acyl-carrier protein] reductase
MSESNSWLAERVALLVGAGNGVGQELAARLAEGGAAVVVADSNDAETQRIVAGLGAKGGRARADPLDRNSPDDVDRLVQTTLRDFGHLDFLVNCANHHHSAPIGELSEADWNAMLAAQLTGAFLACRAAFDSILASRGRVVNVTSEDAFRGRRQGAHSAAAQAGLVALTKVLASELAPTATANAVSVGTLAISPEESLLKTSAPLLSKAGEPGDVAEAVLFFLSPAASWITGQVLHVNGGEFMP